MFYGRRDFVDVIKIMDLEVGKLSGIFLVIPNWSHEFTKAENLWLERNECRRWTQHHTAAAELRGAVRKAMKFYLYIFYSSKYSSSFYIWVSDPFSVHLCI